MKVALRWLAAVAALLVLSACEEEKPAKKSRFVNLYSSQKEHLIRPVLDRFTADTGIQVNLTSGKRGALLSRLELEGESTPADILLTSDIGVIYQAQEKELLQPVRSKTLEARIPAHLRDPEGHWFALTTRARVLFFAKKRVDASSELSSYEDLASPQWKGRILARSSNNVYNQSLLASIIAHDGEAAALAWANGVVANMARPPHGGDRDQIRAIAAGEGDVAIANSYYYARMIAEGSSDYDAKVVEEVGIFFPNQSTRGAHVNIRGGGVLRHAKRREEAVTLLEYLSGDEAQRFFSNSNYEFPAALGVEPSGVIKPWTLLKQDSLDVSDVGKYNPKAVEIFDQAGWK